MHLTTSTKDDKPETGDIAEQIRNAHTRCVDAVKVGLDHAKEAGNLLITAKSMIGHGEWLPWLRDNCPEISERTAQAYMRCARNVGRLEGKSATVADLSFRGALEMLAEPKSVTIDESVIRPTNMSMIPPDGLYTHLSNDRGSWAIIVPSIHAGFYHITQMIADGFGGMGMEGTKKPIRADRVHHLINTVFSGCKPTFEEPDSCPSMSEYVFPWDFNRMFYFSKEQYLDHAVLGRTMEMRT